MNSYYIPKDTTNAALIDVLKKAVSGLVKASAVELYSPQKKDHFFQRVNGFVALSTKMLELRTKQMPVSLLWDGTSIFNARYIELQLVDSKDTIVYAAATLEDN